MKEVFRGAMPVEVVCPHCNREILGDREKIGADIRCPDCRVSFSAVAAVACEKCGSFRHPAAPVLEMFPR